MRRLSRRPFARNLIIFMSGAAIAQALSLIASPVLTRLYNPEAFGVFAVFTTIVFVLGLTVTGRYEQAIVLPNSERDAASLLGLSFLSTVVVTTGIAILIWLSGATIANWLSVPELIAWLWLIPPYLFTIGVFNSLNYWSTRRNRFSRLSVAQMLHGGSTIGLQILAGFARFNVMGLIGGKVIGQALASVVLFLQVWREDGLKSDRSFSLTQLRELAYQHRDFPRYGMPQALVNALSVNLFTLVMSPFFGPSVVGYYALTQRVLALPTRLLGDSIRQVFFPKASELIRSGGDVYRVWRMTTLGLLAVGLIPFSVILLFGPQLFAFIFGAEWYQAGVYARLLVPWTYVSLANPPSVMMMPVLNKQGAYMGYELISLLSRAVAIIAGVAMGSEIAAVTLFSATGFCLNAGLIVYVMMLTRQIKPAQQVLFNLARSD
jgi:lipopolysaccharide exporter